MFARLSRRNRCRIGYIETAIHLDISAWWQCRKEAGSANKFEYFPLMSHRHRIANRYTAGSHQLRHTHTRYIRSDNLSFSHCSLLCLSFIIFNIVQQDLAITSGCKFLFLHFHELEQSSGSSSQNNCEKWKRKPWSEERNVPHVWNFGCHTIVANTSSQHISCEERCSQKIFCTRNCVRVSTNVRNCIRIVVVFALFASLLQFGRNHDKIITTMCAIFVCTAWCRWMCVMGIANRNWRQT